MGPLALVTGAAVPGLHLCWPLYLLAFLVVLRPRLEGRSSRKAWVVVVVEVVQVLVVVRVRVVVQVRVRALHVYLDVAVGLASRVAEGGLCPWGQVLG